MGMAYYVTINDLIGPHYYIYIHTCSQFYTGGGNTRPLSLNPLPFIKDTLSAKALTLSTAIMDDTFECHGIHTYANDIITAMVL